MTDTTAIYDLFIIGGGINGAGIARDAAGRGLRVGLCERADFAQATSSASSKLIHGGLRYLEHYEFRLVAEALAERERLLKIAPHIAWPMRFVLPHEPHLRPAWLIRLGLFLYDHLHLAFGVTRSLPSSHAVTLSAPLKTSFTRGFEYSDAWVDDARLVILNLMSARDLGANILARTEFVSASREGDTWLIHLKNSASEWTVRSKTVVNAAGPWVAQVASLNTLKAQAGVQLVKGSHIIVPRVHASEQAFILQQADGRIVFVIPYEGDFTLIGTTDVRVQAAELSHAMTPSADEITYLITAANTYLAQPITQSDIVHSYAGVRPLYDDGSANASKTTRDYTLIESNGWLDVFGGKLTTYRYLAQEVMTKLKPQLPNMGATWTASTALPGGDFDRFDVFFTALQAEYPALPAKWLAAAAHRHGTNIRLWLGKAQTLGDLGADLGGGLYEAEAAYLREFEWADTLDDMLWRRSKCGLHAKAKLVCKSQPQR